MVNALSEELLVEVLRGGVLYRQGFSRGIPKTQLTEEPAPAGAYVTGTKVLVGSSLMYLFFIVCLFAVCLSGGVFGWLVGCT